MASVRTLLDAEIYALIKADDPLWISIGGTASGGGTGNLYPFTAPTGAPTPYLTYSFGSTAIFEAFKKRSPVGVEMPFHFDIFSDAAGPYEAEGIQDKLFTMIEDDDFVITLTGYKPFHLRRGSDTQDYEKDTHYYHISNSYMGIIVPT